MFSDLLRHICVFKVYFGGMNLHMDDTFEDSKVWIASFGLFHINRPPPQKIKSRSLRGGSGLPVSPPDKYPGTESLRLRWGR